MITATNVQQAKTHFSKLLARAEAGERIPLARSGRVVAYLVPAREPDRRQLGFLRGSVPQDFFEPLPEDELARWEGA